LTTFASGRNNPAAQGRAIEPQQPWKQEIKEMKGISIPILVAALVCFLAIPQLQAQNPNAGEIRGTVFDSTGAVIAGATVTIRNVNTNVVLTETTNEVGIYRVLAVQPGEYVLSFAKEGFETVVHRPITVRLEIVTVDARLNVGSTTTQVMVEAQTPLLQTESSEHSVTITATEMAELPSVGRTWWSFTQLIPGNVGYVGGGGSGDDIRANGQGGYTGSFLVDGGNATFVNTQSSGEMKVPNEAIAEVKWAVGNFSAEYGNGQAVFNVITKGGTNELHGSVFYDVQNEALNSSDYFRNLRGQEKPQVRWNQFGGSLGGPIVRDKAFFFVCFQRLLNYSHTSGFYTFPDSATRTGDFSALLQQAQPIVIHDPYSLRQVNGEWVRTPLPGNRMSPTQIDPVAQKIASYFPEPNLPGLIENYYWADRANNNRWWLTARGDYNINSSHRLNASILLGQQLITMADPRPQNHSEFRMRANQMQVSHVWVASSTVVNELRLAGFVWPHRGETPSANKGYPQQLGLINTIYDIFPRISISGQIGGSGIGGGVTTRNKQGRFNPSNVLSWNKGRHFLKFGVEYGYGFSNTSAWGDMSAGNFSFSGLFSRTPTGGAPGTVNGLGFADFLFGLPNWWGIGPIAPWRGFRIQSTQGFAQDDFKLRHNLTLNVGIRWLYQGGFTEVHDRLASFDPDLINPATNTPGAIWYAGQQGRRALQDSAQSVAPRIGLAWSPKPGWAIRAAYGTYQIPWSGANYLDSAGGSYGWSLQGSLSTTDQLTPVFTLGPTPAGAVFAYPNLAQGPHAGAIMFPTPADRPASLMNGQSVNYSPREVPISYTHQAQFSIQRQLADTVLKVGYIYTRGVNLTFYRDLNQVPADKLGPGDAQLKRPYPQFQTINALLSDGSSVYHGVQFSVQRHFSRGFSFLASYTFSKNLDTNTGWGWDSGSGTWQIGSDPMANYGISDNDRTHNASGGFVYQLPFGKGRRMLNRGGVLDALVGGWQLSSMFRLLSGAPFTPTMSGANLSGALSGAWRPNRIGKGTVPNPTIDLWFDPSAFAAPDPYTFGNSGRNILRGPGFKNVDLSLAKSVGLPMLGEAGQLQLRVDATNALNITNWGMPLSGIGGVQVGAITWCHAMRAVQIGAKLAF